MFLHRYARTVGMPVPILMSVMNAADIAEAMAYDRLDPCGEQRSDLRMGIIASLLANINRGKNVDPFKPADFIPEFGKTDEDIEEDKVISLIEKIKKVFK